MMNKDEGDFEYILNLQKIEEDAEKYLIVAGIATTETRDHDNEIVDLGSVRDVWKSYMENPVVRYFHGKDRRNPDAVGMVVPEHTDSNGKTWKTEMTDDGPFIVAKISNAPDTESIRTKISEGIIKGFSIGGRAKRVKEYSHELGKDINRVLTQRISEISIVDLPANPDSYFNVLKSACVGDQCKIANDADALKSVEEEIAKLEAENGDLRKRIADLQSSTESNMKSESEEVVMKQTETTTGGKSMEQEGDVVRFGPEELKDFIKGTMTEYADENAILEKADDYDRLVAATKDLRAKIEALEDQVKTQAKALHSQPQTTMKSEDTDDSETDEIVKEETESDELSKMEALEARLKQVEESPLYKAKQDDEVPIDDKKKSKKGHLANIVSESFGTGGK